MCVLCFASGYKALKSKLVFKINFLMLWRTKQQICYLKQPPYQLNYQMQMAYWSNSGKKPKRPLKKQAIHSKDLYSSHSRTVHKQYGCSQLCWLPWFSAHSDSVWEISYRLNWRVLACSVGHLAGAKKLLHSPRLQQVISYVSSASAERVQITLKCPFLESPLEGRGTSQL